jgi:hypothetical protein
MWAGRVPADHHGSRPARVVSAEDRPMPYHPHLINALAQDRQADWRRQAAEDRRALAATRPDPDPSRTAAPTPDPSTRGRGLTFHGLYRRLTGGAVRP